VYVDWTVSLGSSWLRTCTECNALMSVTSSLYEDGSPACCSVALRHTSSSRLWYSVLLPLSIRVRGSFGSRCTVRSSFVHCRSSVDCVHCDSPSTSIVVVVVSSFLAVLSCRGSHHATFQYRVVYCYSSLAPACVSCELAPHTWFRLCCLSVTHRAVTVTSFDCKCSAVCLHHNVLR
jgi:hypothetical protein